MSQENVEVVRRMLQAFADGGLDAMAEFADPDIEFVAVGGPQPGAWSGLAGMAEGWREWLSAWEDFRQEVDEYRELDDERVLVLFRMFGRGRTSGLDLAQMHPLSAGVFHVRDGRVTRFIGYFDHERALEAVGLRE